MGRPKGGTNVSHSKEEKLTLVLRNLEGETLTSLQKETGVYKAQIHKRTKQYLEGGEEALVNKRKPGNPLARFANKKNLTRMEQLEYMDGLYQMQLCGNL